MPKSKCPICGKPYNDYLKHIWGNHKQKTIKYLQERRKARKSTPSKRSKRSGNGMISDLRRIVDKYS